MFSLCMTFELIWFDIKFVKSVLNYLFNMHCLLKKEQGLDLVLSMLQKVSSSFYKTVFLSLTMYTLIGL